jgi:hypothetical protein
MRKFRSEVASGDYTIDRAKMLMDLASGDCGAKHHNLFKALKKYHVTAERMLTDLTTSASLLGVPVDQVAPKSLIGVVADMAKHKESTSFFW